MSIPVIEIFRDSQNNKQTLSTCKVVIDNQPMFASVALERGWKGNQSNISCIPMGTYEVVLEFSPRFNQDLWEIKGVPNRSECKFHSSNYWYQLNGCVALGRRPSDIDKDGYLDVTSSKSTMKDFHKSLKGYKKAILIIKGRPSLK